MHFNFESEDLKSPPKTNCYSCIHFMDTLSKKITEEQERKKQEVGEEQKDRGMEGRGTLTSWSSILVPGRPTLHLLSPSASHQKGIYRVPWLRAPSLASIIICASGVGQNWPCINKQKGRRTVNKQHIRDNQRFQNETLSIPQIERWTHGHMHRKNRTNKSTT